MSHHKRKMKNFILMPKTQLPYLYYLMAIISAPLTLFFVYVYLQLRKLHLELELTIGVPESVLLSVDQFTQIFTMATFLVTLIIIALIVISTILASHRFVGPMFVINKYINAIKNGEYKFDRDLRKYDEMKETLALLKELAEALSKEEKNSEESKN